MAWATGHRVFHHIDYAVSQKNNHAISEACGLLLVSQLFPKFREADRWRARGRDVMCRELRRQIYADGSYVQHSMNYQRVMMHGALLALRLAELREQPFERDIYERLGSCAEFFFQLMDPETGRLPNYGNNDGALVLPLSECDFTDYRPVIQATHYLARRRRILPPGPWDEETLWLFGSESLDGAPPAPRAPESATFPVGGYYTLRGEDSSAMTRAHTYRDRPGQLDGLHLDLWWRGHNILCDCGTFQYFTPDHPGRESYFKSAAAHNTLELDRRDPLELVSRFLWLPWPRGTARHFETANASCQYFESESRDYDRAPWHVLYRRAVIALDADTWIIVDDVLGKGRQLATLRWHLLDLPYELDHERRRVKLKTPDGPVFITVAPQPATPNRFEIVRGLEEDDRVQGFAAPYYADLQPIPTLEIELHANLPQRILTVVSPHEPAQIQRHAADASAETWELTLTSKQYSLNLAAPHPRAPRIMRACEQTTPRSR